MWFTAEANPGEIIETDLAAGSQEEVSGPESLMWLAWEMSPPRVIPLCFIASGEKF